MEAMLDADSDAIRNVCQDGNISETVVETVATATGVDPLELEPLYAVVDPDALDSIVRPSLGSAPDSLEIRFSMAGCQVLVRGDGEVVVTPPSKSAGASATDVAREA